MSYAPHHYRNDPDGLHRATRAAHQKIRDLDHEIASYTGDHNRLMDLKRLQGELVSRHGLPPSS